MQSRRCGAILCALGLTATFAVLAPARSADAAPNSITVKTPTTDQVVQREAATGTADVSVSGTLDVTGPVEASLDGTNWTPLGVTGTTFSGVLEDQPVGRATLQVRSTTAPAVSTSVPGVGVGDVFAVMGDSNTSGESPTLHTYTGPPGQVSLFTNARRWRTLTADPVDGIDEDAPLGNCRWFFFTCLHHALYDAHVAGTIWPGVASRLTTAAPGVPIGLVVMGKSASGLFCDPARVSSTCWQKPTGGWAADTTLSLYADALARLRAMAPAGGIRAVLWFEGINDTGSAGTATGRSDYLAMVNRFVANLVTDYGPLDFVLSSPGDCDPALKPTCAGRDTALDNVRGGVEDAWASTPHVVEGPLLYDIDKSTGPSADGLHYREQGAIDTAADRVAAALATAYYGAQPQDGPRLVSATGSDSSVHLVFDTASLTPSTAVGGIRVERDGTPVPSQSAVAASGNEVDVALTGSGGILTVSIVPGRTGQGSAIVRDADGNPAHPAFAVPVIRGGPDVIAPTGSIVIADGTAQTTATTVSVSLAASDDRSTTGSIEMKVSNAADLAGAGWQPFSPSLTWTLTAGTGTRTVYARFRDAAGNESAIVSDSIEVVAPPSGPVRYVGGQLTLSSGSFGASIRPADFFGLRGTVNIDGVSYNQRNDVTRCGPSCVQGSAFAWFRPNQTWKADLNSGTVTINGTTRTVISGTLDIS
ncbi:MAG: sialate O-acetylesterase [Acidimicrobiia bacterium]|nr:sialate O-acetylesterase [Acidimicrobiia bacterium]